MNSLREFFHPTPWAAAATHVRTRGELRDFVDGKARNSRGERVPKSLALAWMRARGAAFGLGRPLAQEEASAIKTQLSSFKGGGVQLEAFLVDWARTAAAFDVAPLPVDAEYYTLHIEHLLNVAWLWRHFETFTWESLSVGGTRVCRVDTSKEGGVRALEMASARHPGTANDNSERPSIVLSVPRVAKGVPTLRGGLIGTDNVCNAPPRHETYNKALRDFLVAGLELDGD